MFKNSRSEVHSVPIIFRFILGSLAVLSTIVLLEVLGYAYLLHFDLDGNYSETKGTLLRIKGYLADPLDTNVKPKYLPQHTVGYIQNPYYSENGVMQNNCFGWRGNEPKLIKDDGAYRIVCLGGSTTYGYGVISPDSSYPALLNDALCQLYPNRKVEVINAGIDGLTSFEEIQNYLFKIRYLKPDAIILKTGGNDAADNTNPSPNLRVHYSPDMHLSHLYYYNLPGVNPKLRFLMRSHFLCALNIVLNYGGLNRSDAASVGIFARQITETHEWFTESLSFALTHREYYSFYQNLNSLMKLMTEDGIKVYLMPFAVNEMLGDPETMSEYYELNRINNSISEELTAQYGQTWIPLTTDSIPSYCWLGDDCHFNSKGNQFTARFIARHISIN